MTIYFRRSSLILRNVKYICEPRSITVETNFPLSSTHVQIELKINRNLVKYPIIFSMLEEENIIRCLIATNGKPSVNTHNGVNHIALDMSLKDYKKLPIVSALK